MFVLYGYAAPIEAGSLLQESTSGSAEFLELGVGKARSACTLARRLSTGTRPDLVVSFGVCGVYDSGADNVGFPQLGVGDLCVVTEDGFADEGVQTEDGFLNLADLGLAAIDANTFAMDRGQTARWIEFLGAVPVRATTVSTCSGNDALASARAARTGAAIETMEGAAIALVCKEFAVPLVQVRCVSNRTGDRARAGWNLAGACERIQAAVRTLLRELSAT